MKKCEKKNIERKKEGTIEQQANGLKSKVAIATKKVDEVKTMACKFYR